MFNCLFCDYSGPRPDKGKLPRPSNRTVRICPSCRGTANPEQNQRYLLMISGLSTNIHTPTPGQVAHTASRRLIKPLTKSSKERRFTRRLEARTDLNERLKKAFSPDPEELPTDNTAKSKLRSRRPT